MGAGEISYSLGRLQRLAETFPAPGGVPPRGTRHRRAIELLRTLGDTAVPLLLRRLRTGSDEQASWAYFLLSQLGGERVVAGAHALTAASDAPDARKALALALLTELGADLPDQISLKDPDALRASSVGDLVGRLSEPGDVARAADLLVEQVVPGELGAFVGEMAEVARGGVTPLVDELLARDDVEPEVARALGELRARLPDATPLPRPRGRATTWLARHDDGRVALVATRQPPAEQQRRRALVLQVTSAGVLGEGRHEADLPLRGGLRALADSLGNEGFSLKRVRPREAADLIARAACLTRLAGRRLPRAYFLGRDLLGLTREHLAALPVDSSGRELAGGDDDPLAHVEELLETGRFEAAAARARPFVDDHPDDPDGRALYGSALLGLCQPEAALPHLAAAARLAPEEPLHHWNHSHAAKQCEKMGACYLALRRYLNVGDRSEGASGRATIARKFIKLFEKYARLEHADASVDNVARCEELFERACAHLDAGRHPEAQSGFEAVLKLVPSHYQSWSNLGVTLLWQKRHEEAERCLKRALELRPDYDVARKNLAMLEGRA